MHRVIDSRTLNQLRRSATFLAIGAAALGANTHALALNIILTPLSATNHPTLGSFNAENPSFDADGSKLLTILEHVASRYEDVFETTHTLEITWWWDADMTFTGQSIPSQVISDTNGRVLQSTLRFNPNSSYFLDPTPQDNSEFNMQQILFQDLSASDQGDRFGGNTPSVFEAGYKGAPVGNVLVNPSGGTLADMVTLAFHEMGHAIGMSSGLPSVTNGANTGEADDLDFDLDPNKVNGNVMDVKVREFANPSATNGPRAHLAGVDAVMGTIPRGNRILPSATDMLAIAVAGQYGTVDLPRQDFLGGADWNTGFNWLGGQVPGSADDAYIRLGHNVSMSANGRVENLEISNSSELSTLNNQLTVDDTLTIEHDSAALRPFLRIATGGQVVANDLNINGGELFLLGGTADIGDDLTIRTTDGQRGRLTGNGVVEFDGDFTNGGLIRPFDGTITINANSAFLNLDGIGGAGEVDATVGNLVVNGALLGSYDGVITVGDDRTVTFNNGWILGASGKLNLQGGATSTDAATIAGTSTTLEGPVDIDGYARIASTNTTIDGAQINIAANGPAGTLEIDGNTVYAAGQTVGSGIFKQDGDVMVVGDFSVANATYDWDGNGASDMTINPGVTFSISSSTIEPAGDIGRDATVTVNGGTLSVLPAWRLDGTLSLIEANGQVPVFEGTGGLTVHTTGKIIVVGDAQIDTTVTFNGDLGVGQIGQAPGAANFNNDTTFADTADVTIESGSVLSINADATYHGGTHTGNGLLRINANATIINDTTIATAGLDLDGDTDGDHTLTITAGHTLTLNAASVDTAGGHGDTIIIENNATLDVSTTNAWTLDPLGVLRLAGAPDNANATLAGQNLSSSGVIEGNGRLGVRVVSRGVIRPGLSAGVLNFQDDLIHADTATMEIQVGGTTPNQQHDVVAVTGAVSLDGTLDIETIDGFVPDYGDTFEALTYGSRSGVFAQVNGAFLSPMMALGQFYDTLTPNTLTLLATAPGDANGDLIVTIDDFGMLAGNFNQPGTWETGDFDGDGMTTINDFGLLAGNFNGDFNTLMAAAAQLGVTTTIPEPTTAMLLGIAVSAMTTKRRGPTA